MSKLSNLALAATMLALASPVYAQGTGTGDTVDVAVNDTTGMTTQTRPVDDDNDFPWGLLGLLGLAGLLGRKRDNDVHVNRTTNSTDQTRR